MRLRDPTVSFLVYFLACAFSLWCVYIYTRVCVSVNVWERARLCEANRGCAPTRKRRIREKERTDTKVAQLSKRTPREKCLASVTVITWGTIAVSCGQGKEFFLKFYHNVSDDNLIRMLLRSFLC